MDVKECISRGLTYKTLEAAKQYFERMGEKNVSIDRARRLLGTHFENMLDVQYNSCLCTPKPDVDDADGVIFGMFGTGFDAGYMAGVKDMETVMLKILSHYTPVKEIVEEDPEDMAELLDKWEEEKPWENG